MEIAPGVHRLEDVTGSNVVLLADERMAVVDTGISGNGEAIVSYIRKIGRSPSDLRWIIVTHFHFDHSGSAAELHELTGARIVAHKDETEPGPDGTLLLRKGNEGESPPTWYRWAQRVAGGGGGPKPPREPRRFPDTPVHETVEHGDVVPCMAGLRIIHSPGHTPGSISPLLTGPRALFLGDSVLNNIDRLRPPAHVGPIQAATAGCLASCPARSGRRSGVLRPRPSTERGRNEQGARPHGPALRPSHLADCPQELDHPQTVASQIPTSRPLGGRKALARGYPLLEETRRLLTKANAKTTAAKTSRARL